jgi:hypothetical protein
MGNKTLDLQTGVTREFFFQTADHYAASNEVKILDNSKRVQTYMIAPGTPYPPFTGNRSITVLYPAPIASYVR